MWYYISLKTRLLGLRVVEVASLVIGLLVDSLCWQIEEKINIDTLELLKQAFQEADEDGSGELDLDEFKILLKSKLNLAGTKVGYVCH